MTVPRPEAVIWDWDGTLVDSWPAIQAALNATFEAFGKETWTLDQTLHRVRKSMRDTFPAMFGDEWEKAAEMFTAHVAEHHLKGLRVLDGAAELVAAVADEGFVTGVVSNKQGPILRAEIEHLGWAPYIRCAVGAGDASADKPDPAPMAMVLDGSGMAAGPAVWYVGDTAIDMAFAVAAGCTGVLVAADTNAEENFTDAPPAYRFASRPELARHLAPNSAAAKKSLSAQGGIEDNGRRRSQKPPQSPG